MLIGPPWPPMQASARPPWPSNQDLGQLGSSLRALGQPGPKDGRGTHHTPRAVSWESPELRTTSVASWQGASASFSRLPHPMATAAPRPLRMASARVLLSCLVLLLSLGPGGVVVVVSRLVGKSVCACFSRACCDEKWPATWRARAWEEDAAAAPAVYVSPAPPPFSFLGPLSRRKISCQARRKASRAAPRDSAATPGGRRDFAAPTAPTPLFLHKLSPTAPCRAHARRGRSLQWRRRRGQWQRWSWGPLPLGPLLHALQGVQRMLLAVAQPARQLRRATWPRPIGRARCAWLQGRARGRPVAVSRMNYMMQ